MLPHDLDRFIGISPFENPDPAIVIALCKSGALGVLDLGRDPVAAQEALRRLELKGVRRHRRLQHRIAGADAGHFVAPPMNVMAEASIVPLAQTENAVVISRQTFHAIGNLTPQRLSCGRGHGFRCCRYA